MSLLAEYSLILWVSISSWYYGYHISELNFPEPSLTCSSPSSHCLGITSTRYSIITAIFTFGGLVGSLIASKVIGKVGMIGCIWITGVINLIGSVIMGGSVSWIMLAAGRLISGLTAGLALTTVTPLLSLLSQTSSHSSIQRNKGRIGTLNQLAIVCGILSAQLIGLASTGMKGERRGGWRWAVLGSGLVALCQLGLGWVLRGYMKGREGRSGGEDDTERSEDQIDDEREDGEDRHIPTEGTFPSVHSPTINLSSLTLPISPAILATSEEPLLTRSKRRNQESSSIRSLLSNPTLRPKVLLVGFMLAVQQLSGINAVLFYSTSVLQPIVPDRAGLIGIGIALLNVIMTLPPMFLVDRLGKIPLLFFSLGGMIVSSAFLSYGLNTHSVLFSGIPIFTFVASFASGLGPICFLLISDLVPSQAVRGTSSLGTSISWISSFCVALGFLPLRNALSWETGRGEREGEGRVFRVFMLVQVAAGVVVWWRLYRRS